MLAEGIRTLDIVQLTEHELFSLAESFRQFWGEESSHEKMSVSFQKISKNPAYILLAAKQNDRLYGFAMGIICEELYGDYKPFMVIEDIIVDKNQRRNRVGASLMQELEKRAFTHDCSQIIFVTEADRLDAHLFYRAMGYKWESYKGFKKRIGTVNK